jgi:hypothetical protein
LKTNHLATRNQWPLFFLLLEKPVFLNQLVSLSLSFCAKLNLKGIMAAKRPNRINVGNPKENIHSFDLKAKKNSAGKMFCQ